MWSESPCLFFWERPASWLLHYRRPMGENMEFLTVWKLSVRPERYSRNKQVSVQLCGDEREGMPCHSAKEHLSLWWSHRVNNCIVSQKHACMWGLGVSLMYHSAFSVWIAMRKLLGFCLVVHTCLYKGMLLYRYVAHCYRVCCRRRAFVMTEESSVRIDLWGILSFPVFLSFALKKRPPLPSSLFPALNQDDDVSEDKNVLLIHSEPICSISQGDWRWHFNIDSLTNHPQLLKR